MARTSSDPASAWRRSRTRLIPAGLFALALALLALPGAGPALVVSRSVEPPDAIVALASHEWERLPAVVELAMGHPDSTVLLTLPLVITESNCHRCTERPQWLIDQGVDSGRVRTLRDRGRNTYEEAEAVRRYAEQHAVRRLAIVTSPYHTRRALAAFHEVFNGMPVEIGIYPACGTSPARPARWWAQGYDRAYVSYEWAALLYYRVKYGVPLAVSAGGPLPSTEAVPC